MKPLRNTLLATIVTMSTLPAIGHAGAESGVYLGAGVGQSDIEFTENGETFSSDDTGYKFILGYNFGVVPLVDLAIEGAYVDFGKMGEDAGSYEQTAWNGFGLAGLSFGPFGIFAKAGMSSWESETSIGPAKTSHSGTDPVYGVGARLQIMNFSGRIEYEYYDLENIDDSAMASISLLYTF